MNSAAHRLLGINIDHVATLRQARLCGYPSPLRAARQCIGAGADLITLHLREDARHVQESDLASICAARFCRVNLELAPNLEMVAVACRHRPEDCCLVPERREELTTEGGLEIAAAINKMRSIVDRLSDTGIRVSAFIEPDPRQLDAAAELGLKVVELHTGSYANAADPAAELGRLARAAEHGRGIGLQVNAGHGLNFSNIAPVAQILDLAEFNIGHFIVSEALFSGFDPVIARFKQELMKPFAGE